MLASVVAETEKDTVKDWHCKVAAVRTNYACHQNPHLDFEPATKRGEQYVFHAPMSKEGALLAIWNEKRDDPFFLFIPFGCFALVSGDLFHSGIYGNEGNTRLHMVMSKTPFQFTGCCTT